MIHPANFTTKANLIAHLDAARRTLDAAISATREDSWNERVDGDATRTVLLAHIEWWERRGSYEIGVMKSGGTPHRSAESLDQLNARIDRENATREAAEVITSEAGAWWELRSLVLTLSEGELFDERAFPALEGESLQELVQQESSSHWADHIKHFG
ncbi:MAG: ClbS/DfsB family four-helix bundle protein [Candidatus Limnocylindrus sp.]